MKHNYKTPQKPQEKKELERTKLKVNLHISRLVSQVPQYSAIVRETGEKAEELCLSEYRDFLGSRKPDCRKIRFLR